MAARLLVIPYPAQGHLLPLLDLTLYLSGRGLAVTVVVTPKNLHLLDPILSKDPSIQTLVLPFPASPHVPLGVENVKDLPAHVPNPVIMGALSGLHRPLLDWFRSQPSPPLAILSDFFLGWTHRLALELCVPRLVFYCVSAFLVAVNNWLWDRADEVELASPVKIAALPGSPEFSYTQLPSIFRRYHGNPLEMAFVREYMTANNSSWAGVFNTFDALEGPYLRHLREHCGHSRVWAVGPILPEKPDMSRGGESSVPRDRVTGWLDSCPEGSVVYVCFGSEVSLTKRQAGALASGLDRSGARFIWSLKAGTEEVVPAGFDEMVAGRGLLIRGWAPQVAILTHRSVGAFLTHCGWNSLLEGIVAGVNLLAWPMQADQHVNARLLVEDTGVGVRVCQGADTVPDSDELALAIAESVQTDRPERARVAELSKSAMDAIREGGRSQKDLDGVVEELLALSSRVNDWK